MTKNIDITKNVMKRIANFERRKGYSFLLEFALVLTFVISVSGVLLYLAGMEIAQQQSLDLLSLFGEDSEIIKEYWRDTLTTFWQELPQEKIILGIILLITAIVLIIIFRKKIKLVFAKFKNLKKIKV